MTSPFICIKLQDSSVSFLDINLWCSWSNFLAIDIRHSTRKSMKIPGTGTQHEEVNGKPLPLQQGSSPAHHHGGPGGSASCSSPWRQRYVKITWKSLGTRHPAERRVLCSPFSLGSSSAPSSSKGWVLAGRWGTQGVPPEQVWGLCRLWAPLARGESSGVS